MPLIEWVSNDNFIDFQAGRILFEKDDAVPYVVDNELGLSNGKGKYVVRSPVATSSSPQTLYFRPHSLEEPFQDFDGKLGFGKPYYWDNASSQYILVPEKAEIEIRFLVKHPSATSTVFNIYFGGTSGSGIFISNYFIDEWGIEGGYIYTDLISNTWCEYYVKSKISDVFFDSGAGVWKATWIAKVERIFPSPTSAIGSLTYRIESTAGVPETARFPWGHTNISMYFNNTDVKVDFIRFRQGQDITGL